MLFDLVSLFTILLVPISLNISYHGFLLLPEVRKITHGTVPFFTAIIVAAVLWKIKFVDVTVSMIDRSFD